MNKNSNSSFLQARPIKCNKEQCKECSHGYDIYFQWLNENNKVREKYIGKLGEEKTLEKINEIAKTYPRVIGDLERIEELAEVVKLSRLNREKKI